jgi:hypothetical protein
MAGSTTLRHDLASDVLAWYAATMVAAAVMSCNLGMAAADVVDNVA